MSAPQAASPASATPQPPKQTKPRSMVSAVSGALSGSLISACVQPLDVIRTKMQGDAALGIHRSAVGTLVAVVQSGGVQGLWRGTGPSVIRVGLGAGLHFMLLEQIKALLTARQEDGGRLSALSAATAGGLSRAVAAALLCPVTVVKTRMEYAPPGNATAAPLAYKNTAHALWTIGRQEGVRGLFQGLTPTILANAPFSGFYYMFYSEIKAALSAEGRPQTLVNFTSGCAAAVAASVLTQPADVLRTRMQLGLSDSNSWSALANIVRTQGMSALLTGVGPRILKRTTQTALVWTLYEELMPRLTTLTNRLLNSKHEGPDGAEQQSSRPSAQDITSVATPLSLPSPKQKGS